MALPAAIATSAVQAAGTASDIANYATDGAVQQYTDSKLRGLKMTKAVDTIEKSYDEYKIQSSNKERTLIASVNY